MFLKNCLHFPPLSHLLLLLLVTASVATGANAQEITKPDPKLPSVKEQLAKEFGSGQMSPEIMTQYATKLRSILASSNSGEWEKLEAIQLLKNLKPELGAPVLADNIGYEVTQGGVIYSPCLKALVAMGEPAVPFIVDKLEKTDTTIDKILDDAALKKLFRKYVLAIVYIKGPKYDDFIKENESKLSKTSIFALQTFAMH